MLLSANIAILFLKNKSFLEKSDEYQVFTIT